MFPLSFFIDLFQILQIYFSFKSAFVFRLDCNCILFLIFPLFSIWKFYASIQRNLNISLTHFSNTSISPNKTLFPTLSNMYVYTYIYILQIFILFIQLDPLSVGHMCMGVGQVLCFFLSPSHSLLSRGGDETKIRFPRVSAPT